MRAPPWFPWPPWSRLLKKMLRSERGMNLVAVAAYLLLILTCVVMANKQGGAHPAKRSVVAAPPFPDHRKNDISPSKDAKKLFSSLDVSADGFLSEKEVTWAIQRAMERHQNK